MIINRLRQVAFISFVSMSLAQASAAERIWEVKPDQSPVSFVAVGKPGFLKIKGEGAKLRGSAKLDLNKLSGEFEVDLSPLTTGIDLRDEHMKEKYLETAKFPVAKLRLDGMAFDSTNSSANGDFTGYLTIKGVEKPVSGSMSLSGLQASTVEGTAQFEIKISDYPIGVPSHLGVTVAESVKISVTIQAQVAGTQTAAKI